MRRRWNPRLHPRDRKGRFSNKPGGGSLVVRKKRPLAVRKTTRRGDVGAFVGVAVVTTVLANGGFGRRTVRHLRHEVPFVRGQARTSLAIASVIGTGVGAATVVGRRNERAAQFRRKNKETPAVRAERLRRGVRNQKVGRAALTAGLTAYQAKGAYTAAGLAIAAGAAGGSPVVVGLLGTKAVTGAYQSTALLRNNYLNPYAKRKLSKRGFARYEKIQRRTDVSVKRIGQVATVGSVYQTMKPLIGTVLRERATRQAGKQSVRAIANRKTFRPHGRGGVYKISSIKGKRVR